jgi:hypothetical protein
VVPQRRKERLAQVYREDLEKYRLRGRKEGFFHYEVSTACRALPAASGLPGVECRLLCRARGRRAA